MKALILTHPYLVTTIVALLAILMVARILLLKSQQRIVFTSSLAAIAPCLFSVYFENEYWSPTRIGGFQLGIEDALFSFDTAATSMLMTILILSSRLTFDFQMRLFIKRSLIPSFLAVIIFLSGCWAGLNAMTSLLLTQAALIAILLGFRPDMLLMAIVGLFGFVPVYFIIVKVYFWMWPDFVYEWNQNHLWGRLVWGVPLGEVVWALGFGAMWPLFVGYGFNGNLLGPSKNTGKGVILRVKKRFRY